MGYRDCEDPEVTCRLVLRADGGAAGYDAASAPLRFGGEIPSRRASIEWVGEGSPGSTTLTPDGVEAHPSWIEMRSSQPERAAEIAPFWVLICAFGEPEPPEDPWGANPWGTAEAEHWVPSNECDYFNEAATIDPENSEAPIPAAVPTWFMGSHGWVDCRTDHCFVQMGRAWVKGARVGGEVVASAVISPDLVDPAKDRPALRVVTPGPHAGGQDVTVAVTGLNPGILSNIALCRSGNEWDCGDVGPLDRIDNGTHLVHLPENFKCSPRCYLELRSPGEGFPALATAPIDVGG
jgi:hypothetical protein